MKKILTWTISLLLTNGMVISQTPMSVEYLPTMSITRCSQGMMVPSDTKFVVIGGHTEGFLITQTAEVFNNIPAAWQTKTSVTSHDMPFMAKLMDGTFLIGGGSSMASGVGQSATCEIYNGTSDVTTPAASMFVARTNASAATLKDGTVLVCGNWYAPASVCDLYIPNSNTFVPTGPCLVQRALPVVIPTDDGGALVFGNIGPYGERLIGGFVEKYNRISNSFQPMPDVLSNGKKLWGINCGQPSFTYQRQLANGKYALLDYDDATNVRIITVDPSNSMMEELVLETAIPLTDEDNITYGCNRNLMIDKTKNLIHIVQVGTSGSDNILRIITINLNNNSVHAAKLTGFDFNVGSSVMEVLADGRILFTGGNKPDNFTLSKKAFLVTPATWAPASGVQLTSMSVSYLPDLTYSRGAQGMIVYNQEKVAVVGGHTEGFNLTNVMEILNLKSMGGSWQNLAPVSSHDMPFMARLNDGKYLIGAGCSMDWGVGQLASVEIFNPSTNLFTAAASMNVARTNASAATLKDGRVLVMGNWYASASTGEVYDPIANTFTSTGTAVYERAVPIIIPTDDNGALVFGNFGTYGDLNSTGFLQKYDATTNSFSALPDVLPSGKPMLGPICGMPIMSYQRQMANGNYVLLDLASSAQLISVNPTTGTLGEIPISQTNLLAENDIPYYCNRNLMIDKQRNLIHIIQSTGTAPYTLRIVTYNLNNGTTNASKLDNFDFFVGSSVMEVLSDGRILFTGGNKPDNFTLSNKAFIVTPATYGPNALAYPKPNRITAIWDKQAQAISVSQDISEATLYNMQGQIVQRFSRGHFFPVEDLPSNLYFLKINNGETIKILKQ
jgi:ribosomal protein L24E